ncbi:MAG: SGNH/GDSL hydrolase family protein [Bacteroidetes bacterium]|nr:SGNH/GDSL hydrolase family protein [Bacteroidota bacterium]
MYRILIIIVWIILIFGLAAFQGFRFYQYGSNLNNINAIAGYTLIAIVFTVLFLFTELLIRWMRVIPSTRTNFRLLMLTILFIVLVVETGLRITGLNASYAEQRFFDNYATFYSSYEDTWFHNWAPNDEHELNGPGEFRHTRSTNSLGLSEREISSVKQEDEYRIFIIGDSFTEGVGAAYDSTWGKHLEKILRDSFPTRNIQLYNAGIAGSDPVYGYQLYKELLVPYQPDLVIQAVNFTDEGDIFFFFFMERLREDGSTWSKGGAGWEPLYALSYIFRVYIRQMKGYEDILIDPADRPALETLASQQITDVLGRYAQTTKEHNADFLAVIHPMLNEVVDQEYEGKLGQLVDSLHNTGNEAINFVDLMPFYVESGLIADNIFDYYWIEYHHNALGYELFAKGVAGKIIAESIIE